MLIGRVGGEDLGLVHTNNNDQPQGHCPRIRLGHSVQELQSFSEIARMAGFDEENLPVEQRLVNAQNSQESMLVNHTFILPPKQSPHRMRWTERRELLEELDLVLGWSWRDTRSHNVEMVEKFLGRPRCHEISNNVSERLQ